MSFDYSLYHFYTLERPVGGIIFSIVVFIGFLIQFVLDLKRGVQERDIIRFVFALFILIGLLVPDITCLVRGGWNLRTETEADALVKTGVIEEIYKQRVSPSNYVVNGNTYYGTMLTINGESYHVMTSDGFAVGDTVLISYLPKSHFVLYIEMVGT